MVYEPEKGLVFFLPKEEGQGKFTLDWSGWDNSGQLIGPTWTNGIIYGATWTKGKIGNALSFDGIDALVSLPIQIVKAMGTRFTIEFWIKPQKWIDPTITIRVIFRNYSWHSAGFGVVSRATLNRFEFHTHFTGGKNMLTIGEWSKYFDKWNHIVCIYDSKIPIQQIWLNGKLVAEMIPTPMVYRDFAAPLRSDNMPSIIDEFRVYGRALTSEEIKQRLKGVDIREGLISEFNFDHFAGNHAIDSGRAMIGKSLEYDGVDDYV